MHDETKEPPRQTVRAFCFALHLLIRSHASQKHKVEELPMAIGKSIVKVYEGDFIFRQGTPYIITATQVISGGDVLSEVYIVLQHVPEITRFMLDTWQIRTDRSSLQLLDDHGLLKNEEPEAFISEESEAWVRNHLNQRNHLSCEEHKAPYPAKEYAIKAFDDWKDILRRLRFRGLPNNILDTILSGSKSPPLVEWMNRIHKDQPIKVHNVRPS